MDAIYNHNFDEKAYLRTDPEAADAVRKGETTAYRHAVSRHDQNAWQRFITSRGRRTVTIVVPCFQAEAFLEHTLESIRQQTFRGWECICVDDFSTDRTPAIIKEYVAKDPRFKLIQHRANGGLSAARNTGIRAARGGYICFLDSDDLMMTSSVENRLRAALAADNERLAGSYSASLTIDEACTRPPPATACQGMRLIDFITAGGMCPFNANQPMFKTAVLRQLGGFDQRLRQAEDWDLWMRLMRHGYFLVPTQITDVTYRERSASMVRSAPLRHLRTALTLYEAAHAPLPSAKIYEGAPFVYDKPWISYKRQLDISRRVLEFCGMAMSDGQINDAAVQLSVQALPDFFGAINPHRELASSLQSGVKRQMVGAGDEAARYTSQLLLTGYVEAWSAAETKHRNAETKRRRSNEQGDYPASVGLDIAAQRETDVVFLPHKDYHVWSFALILEALREAGITYSFVNLSVIYRDEGARRKADELGVPMVSYNEFVLGNYRPKLVVCMNDWDPIVRGILESCQELGIPTVGVVEGVQDYLDADTGRVRRPYRTVNYVLLPGEFDRRYFAEHPDQVRVGGVPRIDELLAENNAFPERPLVVINSNFTYNVLTDRRDEWLGSIVNACAELGYDYLISRHPADKGDFSQYQVANESMYDLIRRGSVFVSRFGSGILEALAMGKPAIYHNPHGEKVNKFTEPNGAFPISTSRDQLVQHLRSTVDEPEVWLRHAADFVELHCGARKDSDVTATQRLALELLDIYRTASIPPAETRARLKYLLIDDAEASLGAVDISGNLKVRGFRPTGDGAWSDALNLRKRLERAQRKAAKLRRDPRAFFEDSRLAPIKLLKHLF